MIYDIERCVGFKIELIDVNQNLRRLSEQFTLITDCILHFAWNVVISYTYKRLKFKGM